MSDLEQKNPSVEINNEASNFGAQGVFYGPVSINTGSSKHSISPTPSTQESQNRQRLLKRVHTFWIKGLLEPSLHHAALITLGLDEQPGALESPWRMVIQEAEQGTQPLPLGTRMLQVYDEADGELLILGEPGAGKTTLLLELARDLLDRAGADESHPIPVVLNLSTWAQKQPPLAAWLSDELETRYEMLKTVCQQWISTDRLLLLFDGLDEVAQVHRTACVAAINIFHREHPLTSLVVCCRRAEYLAEPLRVLLQKAVLVQPLTLQQIDAYLANGGEPLAAIRAAVQTDPALQELAATPLMLSVLALAYQGETLKDPAVERSKETLQQQVFAAYMQKMLHRRGTDARYTPQQVIHWLSWRAKRMAERNLTTFYVDEESILLLTDFRSRQIYYVILLTWIVVLAGCLIGALSYGLATGLIRGFFILPTILFAAYLIFAIIDSTIQPICMEAIFLERGIFKKDMDEAARVEWIKNLFFSVDPFMRVLLVFCLINIIAVIILKDPLKKILTPLRKIPGGRCIVQLIDKSTNVIFSPFPSWLFEPLRLVRHWLFWHIGAIPWKNQHFLDYAVERILLHKVGGSYMFIHRLFLDYFASLNDSLEPPRT